MAEAILRDLTAIADEVHAQGQELSLRVSRVRWAGTAAWLFQGRMRARGEEFQTCASLIAEAATAIQHLANTGGIP